MSQSFHLLQVQRIDTQIDRVDQRLSEISMVINSDQRTQDAAAVVNNREKENISQQKIVKRIEQEIDSFRLKLQQNEHNLYSGKIRFPKELQDLQKEADSLRNTINRLEDNLLDEMIKLEETQANLDSSREEEQNIKAKVISEHSILLGERSRLTEDRERLIVERKAAKDQVTPDNLVIYDSLRKKKRGMAVAAIVDSACTACGSELTPAEYQAARSPTQTVFCPSCGRIIYAG